MPIVHADRARRIGDRFRAIAGEQRHLHAPGAKGRHERRGLGTERVAEAKRRKGNAFGRERNLRRPRRPVFACDLA